MNKFNLGLRVSGALLLWATAAVALPAQTTDIDSTVTFSTLHNFKGTDGSGGNVLVQGTDGNFYGATPNGGKTYCQYSGCGTLFKITPGGKLTTLYEFCPHHGFPCKQGALPAGGLVQAADGGFYGTTYVGGTGPCFVNAGCGTVFKITPAGQLMMLHEFCSQDRKHCTRGGILPEAGLVQSTDGNLYGTTEYGGKPSCNYLNGCGTVFTITPNGTPTTLHRFDGEDGESPVAGLIQAPDGNFYGTTRVGGTHNSCFDGGCGTIFKITPGGELTTLHSFDGKDGDGPFAGLVQAANGDYYGTTHYGGNNSNSCPNGCGTVFKITPSGRLTTLYEFCSQTDCTDGEFPAGLVQATDGEFYGTTDRGGGLNNDGTVFKMTPGGALTTLYKFCSQSNCTDGAGPQAALVQGTDGKFYGTTGSGGENDTCNYGNGLTGCGTVFSLSVGLGPFVETQPTSGSVGKEVKILGTNLTGATGVTFNGTAAAFTVISKSEIITTVPAGATTGTVQVTTSPGTTLSSNVPFTVK